MDCNLELRQSCTFCWVLLTIKAYLTNIAKKYKVVQYLGSNQCTIFQLNPAAFRAKSQAYSYK
jgi:hypothetical protein